MLQKTRINNDVALGVKLMDNGVVVDWSGVTVAGVVMYSDTQQSMDGKCDWSVSPEDSTTLNVLWPAERQLYLGPHRVVVLTEYKGRKATYDALCIDVVESTSQLGGNATNEGEIIGVNIKVEQVSTSLLDAAIRAAFEAAAKAEDYGNFAKEAGEEILRAKDAGEFKGEKGDPGNPGEPGEPGKDGKDGSVLYPSFDINDNGHLIATAPETEAEMSIEIKNGHLILEI